MSSGKNNRDGDNETGNTTGLQFSRLDIDAALEAHQPARRASYSSIDFGSVFDTALDSQGVLHAAYYDTKQRRSALRDARHDGLWSQHADRR